MIQLRDYQEEITNKAVDVLTRERWCYLAMEVRTGKTLTSLSICDRLAGVDEVLFVTKKKAISSITKDSDNLCPSYSIWIINYESLHKLPPIKWDAIIFDEAHSMGAYPKPSKRAKQARELITKHRPYVILLSGTPTPESYSQIYHQLYGIPRSPFSYHKNFYSFAREHVNTKQVKLGSHTITDYSDGRQSILDAIKGSMISYTQSEAGFKSVINEHIMTVDMSPETYALCKQLKDDRVIEDFHGDVILADTAVKLMQKTHQMCSGTVKLEDGRSILIDSSKAEVIHNRFSSQKIGIFYKFVAELELLKEVYGDQLTTDLQEFESTDKSIALQIVSGREGISLRQASSLVYFNIDFSATSYWQSRDRMTTKDRNSSEVYWVFSRGGIEHAIYNAVSKKKDYTLRHFRNDVLSL
jgi:hypothetical protein